MQPDLPPLPAAFVERVRARLGPEADALLSALDAPPAAGLRLNPLKADRAALPARLPWRLEPVPWCPQGYVLTDEPHALRPGATAFHAAGAFYLQDPSAMLPAAALAPAPGERVCDLAAAPGGKTTHLAALMQGLGVLVANDVDAGRARALLSNVERWGAANVVVTQDRPDRLARALPGWFDRVLLDAPCSGEGMFRKSAEARAQWSPGLVARCATGQASLLDAAARLLRPGGVLAYSTCTFEPEENEAAVMAFLQRHPAFVAEAVRLPGVDPLPGDSGAAAVWPHRQAGDGQFVALLRRADTLAGDGRPAPGGPQPSAGAGYGRAQPAPARLSSSWRAFADATLGRVPFAGARLLLHGDRLLAAPPDLPPASSVHLLRVGVLLGRWLRAGDRFEPAHALALAAPSGGAMLSLPESDPRLDAYLRGEPVRASGPDGWLRVAAEGMPLGWARRGGGTVRSLLPRGLRRVR